MLWVVWPLIVLYFDWVWERAHPHHAPPGSEAISILWMLSWFVGFIVAVCGFFVHCENSLSLKLAGRLLCFIAISVEVGCILWAISEFQKFRSSAI